MERESTIAAKAKTSLAILNNEIMEAEHKRHFILPIVLEGDSKIEHDNEWQTYRERNSQLERQNRKEFSMIRGQ